MWRTRVRDWLMANRTSARLALLLRAVTTVLSSVMSFLWTPLLLNALGSTLFGTFQAFQRALRLAGLGDFGFSSGVSLRVGQFIGRGEEAQLKDFLASARSLLLIMAIALGVIFGGLSPWLPHWLGFAETPGSGPLSALFLVGALSISVGIIVIYVNGLNGAYATVSWPIVPGFLFGQAAICGHWLVARTGAPLWVQAIVPLAVSVAQAIALYGMLQVAHPWLGKLRPLAFDKAVWRDLTTASGWIYLYSLGHVVFTSTDALLINAGFGAAAVTPYQLNYKPVEVALQLIGSASYVGQSKINLWIHSPEQAMQERARSAVRRLAIFQSWFGTAAALGYLVFDNLFIALWVGPEFRAPLSWQLAFALNLAITMGGDAGIQVAALCHSRGLRVAGLAIAGTAILNAALSFVAMKSGSIAGIAFATVLAQTVLCLILARFTSFHLRTDFGPWLIRSWLFPVACVTALGTLQYWVGSTAFPGIFVLGVSAVLLLGLHAKTIGVNREFLAHEIGILRDMLGRSRAI